MSSLLVNPQLHANPCPCNAARCSTAAIPRVKAEGLRARLTEKSRKQTDALRHVAIQKDTWQAPVARFGLALSHRGYPQVGLAPLLLLHAVALIAAVDVAN